jgi:hypothetical protein
MPKKERKLRIEKIENEKTDEKVKSDIKKIVIPTYHVDTVEKAKIIAAIKHANIYSYYLPYLYMNDDEINLRREYYRSGGFNSLADEGGKDIREYINDIKDKFSSALGFPFKQQFLYDTIIAIDRSETDDILKGLPRYKRLERLKKFHKNVLDFTLKILHDFLWIDINTNKRNTKPLDDYVQMIIPIIMKLVDSFETELEKEYPQDVIEKALRVEYRKN